MGEKRVRGKSEYWLVTEQSATEDGIFKVEGKGFDTPRAAWAAAAERELKGTVHVLCHRGTKTGGREYKLV